MPRKYPHAGLTPELYQRLVDEFNKLKSEHNRTFTKHIQEVKKCDRRQARKYFQRFNNAVKERSGLSPATTNELKGFLSHNLISELQAYLSEHYTGKPSTGRPTVDKINAGLTKELFQRYREEVEQLRTTYPNSIVRQIMGVKGCAKKEAKAIYSAINALYVEHANLTPRKVIQLEGLLSRELLGEIAKYVFNHYEWPESLDSEVDRITLEYRTNGEVGRNKSTVKHYLYRAYMLGV